MPAEAILDDDTTTVDVTPILPAAADPELIRALGDLELAAVAIAQMASHLCALVINDNFKHLSKVDRNKKLTDMLNSVGEAEDLAKISFRQLKRIKRERPSDELVDQLLTDTVHTSGSAYRF